MVEYADDLTFSDKVLSAPGLTLVDFGRRGAVRVG